MEFTDKKILVLGGDGSIGGVIAEAFAKSGATVFRHSQNQGEYKADLTNSEEFRTIMEKIISTGTGIDIVVNAVGFPAKHAALEKKSWADFHAHLQVQLKSAVEIIPHVLPGMKTKRFGRIINIITNYVEGETPSGLADYITAKHALLGLTRAMAKELGKYNITVNAVSPGFIKNNFTKGLPDKLAEMIIYQTPMGRLATAEDVAGAVLFLASDNASFITGVNLPVSGGSQL